jgi:hypothetical protein
MGIRADIWECTQEKDVKHIFLISSQSLEIFKTAKSQYGKASAGGRHGRVYFFT